MGTFNVDLIHIMSLFSTTILCTSSHHFSPFPFRDLPHHFLLFFTKSHNHASPLSATPNLVIHMTHLTTPTPPHQKKTSLKYHRLHPEYIYTRIRALQGRYSLRILLTMVDIPAHEEALRELSKTSLVNGVTVVLAWSAAEAARYLELYKSYEHAGFGAIRGQQATGYAERLVDFVTVPRSVNRADAVALVSAFGSLRSAVNAPPDRVGVVGGWGEKKVRAWCRAVEAPFRVVAKGRARAKGNEVMTAAAAADGARVSDPAAATAARGSVVGGGAGVVPSRDPGRGGGGEDGYDDDGMEALLAAAEANQRGGADGQQQEARTAGQPGGSAGRREEELSGGIAAALAKLRENG